ncbi:MAG: hypothetical protein EU517_01585 [Promethearchaeota archaeon]|nr:MAG: hypothetical protein EU517_01585 [Candidatus Lokiarchaeota archaeon]
MILVQWSCEVPKLEREKFLNYARNKLKPFYKSNGCLRYELFFPMKTDKKYFSYHVDVNLNRYTECLTFKELKDFNKFYERIEKDKSAQKIVGKYRKQFKITECSFRISILVE